MRNIIYVGDSYCASYLPARRDMLPLYEGVVYTPVATHLNYAADALNLQLYAYGFAGMSWFYSRERLFEAKTNYPDIFNDTDVIVFFHTDSFRFNTIDPMINTGLGFGHCTNDNKHLVEPFMQWQKYLMDTKFQDWAQRAWFKEINELFPSIKKIHFNCFENQENLKFANGMVYNTDLINLSIGELTGSDDEIINQLANDQRHNHFSDSNNRALADIVIESVRNYVPGQYEIDTSKFELINPNAHRYPNPGFGTR